MLVAPIAAAQQAEVTIGYQGLPYKAPGESKTGIQLSDGVLMHVGAGAEAGYDSNVFYPEKRARSRLGHLPDDGVRRRLEREPERGRPAARFRRPRVSALSAIPGERPQLTDYRNAWMPTAGLSLGLGTGQIGFGVADTFARIEDPPYQSEHRSHHALQQPSVDRGSLVAGRRANHGCAPLHQHGRLLPDRLPYSTRRIDARP